MRGVIGNDHKLDAGQPDTRTPGDGSGDLQGQDAAPGWSIVIGGDGADWIQEVVVDRPAADPERLVVLGKFSGTLKLEGVKGDITLTGKSSPSPFIAKLDTKVRKWDWGVVVDGFPVTEGPTGFDGLGVDAKGNIYHAGKFSGQATFGAATLGSAGDWDIFVTKRSADGKVLRAVAAGGPGRDAATGLVVGKDGQLTICGTFAGTAAFGPNSVTAAGTNDLFVASLSPGDLSFTWAAHAGSDTTALALEYAASLDVDSWGNGYVTGSAGGGAAFGAAALSGTAGTPRAYVAKVDPSGTWRWAAVIKDGTHGTDIALNTWGDFYVAGGTSTGPDIPDPPVDGNVLLVAKGFETPQKPAPDLSEPTRVPGDGTFRGYRLVVDGHGSSVVAGSFKSSSKVSFGSKTLDPNPNGATGYLTALDPALDFTKALSIRSTAGSAAVGLARARSGGLYVVGGFTGTATIGGKVHKSTGGSSSDGFVWFTGRLLQ